MQNIISILEKIFVQYGLNWTTFFSLVYVFAIFANGLYGYKFDVNDILMGYCVVAGKSLIGHGINSTLNSPRNQMPEVVNRAAEIAAASKKETK